MKILVANIGSTSFKYRLFDMDGTAVRVLAQGGVERVTDHGSAIRQSLDTLVSEGHLDAVDALDAVGFKTVLGKNLSGCVPADDRALKALDDFKEIAPAHNPPYAASIRYFRETFPSIRLVALFETAFYQWVPKASKVYALPKAWRDLGIERQGFHGASHKYVAERSAELMGREDVAERVRNLYLRGPGEWEGEPLRVVSCHLGGSSSITGMHSGVAMSNSFGLSPQAGIPQNNRVGDLDSAALPYAMEKLGLPLAEAVRQMNKEGGLLGISGVSNDLRDIKAAASEGHADAQLALDVFVDNIRQYVGGYMFKMGGMEALVFTAGIGEHNPDIRAAVCAGLEGFGLKIDPAKNDGLHSEGSIHTEDSNIQVWVIPANEELVIARETKRLLERSD
ncbi:MAG: acetate kinase [Verrucomicrobia bacterium]|nr:acetate kinase [Verrucomicrobiota bacterium]MCH8510152.1 acetate kinase [Kiritimatiellia bacterium]